MRKAVYKIPKPVNELPARASASSIVNNLFHEHGYSMTENVSNIGEREYYPPYAAEDRVDISTDELEDAITKVIAERDAQTKAEEQKRLKKVVNKELSKQTDLRAFWSFREACDRILKSLNT